MADRRNFLLCHDHSNCYGHQHPLGARWDPAKKVWYITDVADLTPFLRWIPDLEKATESTTAAPAQQSAGATTEVPIRRSEGVITKSSVELPDCDCKVLPWEDCEHTVVA